VEELRPTLESVAGPLVHVHTRFPAEALVHGSRAQLRQLLLQPILNACDAMPGGGRLDLTLARVTAPDGRAMISLEFADTGSGMEPLMQARAFEPFVTSKDRTRGTGLGLATVYGIVKASGGSISLSSQPGRGTAITVLLPAA